MRKSVTIQCKRRASSSYDFAIPGARLFLCASGLREHWDIGGAKKIEVRLSTESKSPNAHKFHTSLDYPVSGISIDPEDNEEWPSRHWGTYNAFDSFLNRFIEETGQRNGFMQVNILD